jgi:O-antigen/teichoic acid export membrane protein
MLNKICTPLIELFRKKGFNRYFVNTSWLFAEQCIRMGLGLIVSIWVARYLGPEQFGIFNYVVAFVAMFSVTAKLGLDNVVIRELINNPNSNNIYLGTAFWLKVGAAFFTFSFIEIFSLFFAHNHSIKLFITIISLGIFFQSFEVIEYYFSSQVNSKFISICKLTQLLFSTLIKIALILSNSALLWFIVLILIDQITLSCALYVVYKKQQRTSFYYNFDLKTARSLLRNSWPILISSILVVAHLKVDQIMIKQLLTAQDLGIYSAALRISEIWYFIPIVISYSLFPAIVSAKKIDDELYCSRLQLLITFMTWLGLFIAVTITFSSKLLVPFLYGEAYKNAGHILAVQIWMIIFVFNVSIRSNALLVEQKQLFITLFSTCALIVHVFLNYILITTYGVIGAAYAGLFTWFLTAILFPFFSQDTRKFTLMFFRSFYYKKKML